MGNPAILISAISRSFLRCVYEISSPDSVLCLMYADLSANSPAYCMKAAAVSYQRIGRAFRLQTGYHYPSLTWRIVDFRAGRYPFIQPERMTDGCLPENLIKIGFIKMLNT
jgi:hypothetical protein